MSYQNHNVKINNTLLYAQEFKAPRMFVKRDKTEIPIETGNPKWYFTSVKLRECSFKITMYGDREVNRGIVQELVDRVVRFTCPYIGSFDAIIEEEGTVEDGVPNVLIMELKVQEV